MSEIPIALMRMPEGYADWLSELKASIHSAQQCATLAVNRELVLLYWYMGSDILVRQAAQGWGAKVIKRLAHDLRTFAEAWSDVEFVQAVFAQLPWYHQLALLDKLPSTETRSWYAAKAIEHNWLRNILVMHIETRLHERSGSAVTNFAATLPKPDSDLAQESIKNPYRFDFLCLTDEAQERKVEHALVNHVTEFLLKLGVGFAFVGRQVLLDVGGDEFFIDLLFYHLKLRSYVVIGIKGGKFRPEHLEQLGFYMITIDKQMKHELDNPTIGLLLCKSKNKLVAEYALGDKNQPMGIAEYKLEHSLPEPLETNLHSIEQIERELQGGEA